MPDVKAQSPSAWEAATYALTRKGTGGSATSSLMELGSAAALATEDFEPTVDLVTLSGSAVTLTAANNRQRLRLTHGAPTLTIPLQATGLFPNGFFCFGTIQNGGSITIPAPGTIGGVSGGSVTIGAEVTGADFTLVRHASDAWVCITGSGSGGGGGGGSMTGDAIIAAIGAESAEERKAHLDDLVEDISTVDGVLVIGTGAVMVSPYLVPAATTNRFWMDDAAGNFSKGTFTEAKAALFSGLTGSLYSTSGVITAQTPAQQSLAMFSGLTGPLYSTAGVITARSAAQQAVDMFSTYTGGLYSTAGVMSAFAPWGKNNLWIPGGGIEERLTNGATRGDYGLLEFSSGSDTFGIFEQWLPKAYNASTVVARFVWKHPATTTNFSVTWAIQGACINDGEAHSPTYGTAVVVTDEGNATGERVFISPATAAITLSGTPAKERLARFQVYRDTDGNGTATNDDLAVNAVLIGVILDIVTNAATDD